LDRCLNSKRSLVDIWKNEITPLIGIETPIDYKVLTPESRRQIAPRLIALGMALKQYKIDDHYLVHFINVLSKCTPSNLTTGVIGIERSLRLRR
jgi:hypothetical protein